MNDPASLPPYSLMVSSIGVAPVNGQYGCVHVEELNFFGGALRKNNQPSQAVASMIHAVTFRDQFHCLFNYTSPGISKDFATTTAEAIKTTLLSFTDSWSSDVDNDGKSSAQCQNCNMAKAFWNLWREK